MITVFWIAGSLLLSLGRSTHIGNWATCHYVGLIDASMCCVVFVPRVSWWDGFRGRWHRVSLQSLVLQQRMALYLMGFKQFGGALDPHCFTSPQVYGVWSGAIPESSFELSFGQTCHSSFKIQILVGDQAPVSQRRSVASPPMTGCTFRSQRGLRTSKGKLNNFLLALCTLGFFCDTTFENL